MTCIIWFSPTDLSDLHRFSFLITTKELLKPKKGLNLWFNPFLNICANLRDLWETNQASTQSPCSLIKSISLSTASSDGIDFSTTSCPL